MSAGTAALLMDNFDETCAVFALLHVSDTVCSCQRRLEEERQKHSINIILKTKSNRIILHINLLKKVIQAI